MGESCPPFSPPPPMLAASTFRLHTEKVSNGKMENGNRSGNFLVAALS